MGGNWRGGKRPGRTVGTRRTMVRSWATIRRSLPHTLLSYCTGCLDACLLEGGTQLRGRRTTTPPPPLFAWPFAEQLPGSEVPAAWGSPCARHVGAYRHRGVGGVTAAPSPLVRFDPLPPFLLPIPPSLFTLSTELHHVFCTHGHEQRRHERPVAQRIAATNILNSSRLMPPPPGETTTVSTPRNTSALDYSVPTTSHGTYLAHR